MPRFRPTPRLRSLLCLLASTLPLSAASPSPDEAWPLVERFDFNGALHALPAVGTAKSGNAADDDLRLARAAALLGAQPRTPDNISTALNIARAVVADPDADAAHRITARYLEGRILREHLEPRTRENLALARTCFREVIESGSDHPLALRAVVSLAFGLLYDDPGQPQAERFAAAEELLPVAARHPAAERDLRYVLSQAALVWRLDPAIARDHLRRVNEIGFSQLPRRLNVRVMLGRLSEETGDLSLAETAYRAFLAESVRDAREQTIRGLLDGVVRRRAQPSPSIGPRSK